MDSTAIVAGVVAGLSLAGAWLDLRKRTNGKGPIAESVNKLADHIEQQSERLGRIEDRQARSDERLGRIESKVTEGSRLDRVEEVRIARRETP